MKKSSEQLAFVLPKGIHIYKATRDHVKDISQLTQTSHKLVKRTPREITRLLDYYLVALNNRGRVIGCAGVKLWGPSAELISYRVLDTYQGLGIGNAFINTHIQLLSARSEIKSIFALTTESVARRLFYPYGFIKVGIQLFSDKVISDCRRCQKNVVLNGTHLCDEVAVLFQKPINN